MTEERVKCFDVEDFEVELLLEAIYKVYGYDFRNYSRAHIKRRVKHHIAKNEIASISILQHNVIHSEKYFKQLLPEFSINVTEMFRDPEFFKYLRQEVVPYLRSFPRIKIWHAGCSSGEEVYSLAILLKEEGLYDRATIYATDFNDRILDRAKEGIYDVDAIKEYTKNYIKAGGKEAFSDYYTASYDSVIMSHALKENISFLSHNLVADQSFGEMDLIMCRNVLIYFNRELQQRVIDLFDESLSNSGILCLGTKESLNYAKQYDKFEPLNESLRVFRRMRKV